MNKIYIITLIALLSSCVGRTTDADGSATIDANAIADINNVVYADDAPVAEPEPEPAAEPESEKTVEAAPTVEATKSSEPELSGESLRLRQRMIDSGSESSYRNGILWAMAVESPEYCERLLNNQSKYFLVADKGTMNVILFDRYGQKVKQYKMACAKNYGTKHERRDCRTPEGFFSAGDVYDSSDWLYTDDDGKTSDVKGQYGPRFIRVKNPVSSQIGIHGTCAPWALGARTSHGCIRLHNDNILDLVQYVETGMPIIVNPSSKDVKVNESEGYKVTRISVTKGKSVAKTKTETENPAPKSKTDTLAKCRKDGSCNAEIDSLMFD